MEVKIGVTDSPRELIFNSAQTPDEVEKLVTAALSQGDKGRALLSLTDEKGRRFLVQSARIAYVESVTRRQPPRRFRYRRGTGDAAGYDRVSGTCDSPPQMN